MSDDETLGVYAEQTEKYVAMMEKEASRDKVIDEFIAACPKGGTVLDLGCGPGHYAQTMADAGLKTSAWDAVPEMVAHADARDGVTARVARFDDLTETDAFDGIWAYFSLLHAPRDAFPRHLKAIARALKPGGIFVIAVKSGTGGARDKLGRHYEYYEQPELEDHLRAVGLTPTKQWTGVAAGLAGHPDGWIAILAHG